MAAPVTRATMVRAETPVGVVVAVPVVVQLHPLILAPVGPVVEVAGAQETPAVPETPAMLALRLMVFAVHFLAALLVMVVMVGPADQTVVLEAPETRGAPVVPVLEAAAEVAEALAAQVLAAAAEVVVLAGVAGLKVTGTRALDKVAAITHAQVLPEVLAEAELLLVALAAPVPLVARALGEAVAVAVFPTHILVVEEEVVAVVVAAPLEVTEALVVQIQ